MGSCFGHIANLNGKSNRNPIIHSTIYNTRTNQVELKFLLEDSQQIDNSVPSGSNSHNVPFIQKSCAFISWENLKISRKKWRDKLRMYKNRKIGLRNLKPELNGPKDNILTLDAKNLLKMKTELHSCYYLPLSTPPSSVDLEWENEGLSITGCIQSDYGTTLATISSDEESANPSLCSSIESLEWDLGLSLFTDSSCRDAKRLVTELEDFTAAGLNRSNPDR